MSGSRNTRGTFVVLKHANQRRTDLSKYTKRTLGMGNLREAVRLPSGEDINEWIATNIVDFYNEIAMLYDMCSEDAEKFVEPGEGFPPNFEYRWADGGSSTPIRCSSPEYANYVLAWIEEQIHDVSIFVVDERDDFPDDFEDIAQKIFTRIFRIYAIIYHAHFHYIEDQGAAEHLNTSFKHFCFFSHEHGLLDPKEVRALQEPVDRLLEQYTDS
ncbi:MOB kinase activator-like 1A [Hondaea fermentalgiana]|uniref:MOB kinase activator-like 1A n=1 Tax=Hondaea fermentalgiana TaxID=2315210 RepID=A0A2R5G2P9_9STRA|nr:MOB kinase activator-like 1A [Hondaea fermentalgiana]|eukprot:GBG25280.1 MOB kinase activator-like 1A [Hondaea fermentalgiana]